MIKDMSLNCDIHSTDVYRNHNSNIKVLDVPCICSIFILYEFLLKKSYKVYQITASQLKLKGILVVTFILQMLTQAQKYITILEFPCKYVSTFCMDFFLKMSQGLASYYLSVKTDQGTNIRAVTKFAL